jgi:hypothetical protein
MKIETNLSKQDIMKLLTGIDSLRCAPPIIEPFWKFLGKTSFPNLCSLSLFQEMPFLFTVKFVLLTEKLYVSLNKLQAMRPQGTIDLLFAVSSGLQALTEFSPLGLLNCSSLRLLTYLNYRR